MYIQSELTENMVNAGFEEIRLNDELMYYTCGL